MLNLAGQGYGAGVREFVSQLTRQLQQQNGNATAPACVDGTTSAVQASVQKAAAAAGGSTGNVQLLLVVLPDDKGQTYDEVKGEAAGLGIPTQCMVAAKAGLSSSGGSSQIKAPYVGNMLLKVNQKAGGINWQLPQGPEVWAPKLRTRQLMVLGIDVGHGIAGGAGKKPSTAAVLGSYDQGCSRYSAAVLEQTAGEEIVLGLREAVDQLLRFRSSALTSRQEPAAAGGAPLLSSGLPDCLLVYRDGVSDSQYVAVLQEEVEAIRQACRDVGGHKYQPKVGRNRLYSRSEVSWQLSKCLLR